MADRIQISELEDAITKAAAKVASIKIGHGPIIMGFVAPPGIDAAKGRTIAEEVVKLSGVKGKPTVITEGVAATGLKEHADSLVKPHIIIGLVLDTKSRT